MYPSEGMLVKTMLADQNDPTNAAEHPALLEGALGIQNVAFLEDLISVIALLNRMVKPYGEYTTRKLVVKAPYSQNQGNQRHKHTLPAQVLKIENNRYIRFAPKVPIYRAFSCYNVKVDAL